MDELTTRQKEVLRIIQRHTERGETFPTLREIAQALGVNNHSGIVGHIRALEKKGYLQRHGAFSLTDQATGQTSSSFPLMATIPAGHACFTFDQVDEHINFDQNYFSRGNIVAIKISGESMAGDAICDGDIGIIKMDSKAGKNDVVVVRIDGGEVTLKRIEKKNNIVELKPSNPNFQVRRVPADKVEVIGKLVGIVRKT